MKLLKTQFVILVFQFLLGHQFILSQVSSDCSCIGLKSVDQVVFGRNHDATLSNCLIVYNPRNIYKEGFEFPGENYPKWTSKYASITFNVLGVGFAVCGMNEKGLAMGHMGFNEAQYPAKDTRPVLDQIQYIAYLLDNCSNNSEVVKTTKEIRISVESTTKEHYFVCDKSGQLAIIEFINGVFILYTNKTMPFPILSNDNYNESIGYLKKYKGFGGSQPVPERNFGVEEIMAIGCNFINNFNNKKIINVIDSAFDLLNDIGFNNYPPPDSLKISKEYGTQFSTVFDLKNLKVFFRTKSNPEIRTIDFNFFNPECIGSMKMVEAEKTSKGNINALLTTYSLAKNSEYVNNRFKKIDGMSKEVIDFLATYPETYKCK